jgi:hypothetical protein
MLRNHRLDGFPFGIAREIFDIDASQPLQHPRRATDGVLVEVET